MKKVFTTKDTKSTKFEMNMVLIHSYLQKLDLVSLLDLQTYIANYPIHVLIKHCSPVLRR